MNHQTPQEFGIAARTFLDDSARRYRQLADAMNGLSKHETAAVFRHLETMQRDAWQEVLGPPGPDDAADARQDNLWVGGDDELLPRDIVDSIYSLTPVRAINLALHNNQRALRFLTDILARTSDDDVGTLADRLYRAVLDQIVRLRLERRQVRRRLKTGEPDEELTLLRGSRNDIERYRRYRDICLARLHDRLTIIARSVVGEERETMLALAAAISPPPDTKNVAPPPLEGNAVAQAIAAVEDVFDALLLTAQHGEEEALFRLAQEDAEKLLPAMRQLRKMSG